MEMRTTDIFIRKAPVQVLFSIFDSNDAIYKYNIFRKTGITYTHICDILNHFVSNGIVEMKDKGRIVEVNLTAKGYEIVKELKSIYAIMGGVQNEKIV